VQGLDDRDVVLLHREVDTAVYVNADVDELGGVVSHRLPRGLDSLGACPSNPENGQGLKEFSHLEPVLERFGSLFHAPAALKRACVPTWQASADYSDGLLAEVCASR
jgi:hypothetical protein